MANYYSDYTWVNNNTLNEYRRRKETLDVRLRDLARKRKHAERNLQHANEALAQVSAQTQQNIERAMKESEARLNKELADLEESIRLEIGRQNAAFRVQIDDVRADLADVNSRIDIEDRRLTELSRRFAEEVARQARAQQSQENRARYYFGELRLLLSQIRELHPDKLTPLEMHELETAIPSIETDLNNGDWASAIALTQNQLASAITLQLHLELLNDEYAQIIIEVNDRCQILSDWLADLMDPVKSADASVEFDGRVSYWSCGDLDRIATKLGEEFNEIREHYEPDMNTSALRQALVDLKPYDDMLNASLQFAKETSSENSSLERLAVQIDSVVSALGGWRLTDSGFDQGDNRRSYHMFFDNGAGMRATIIILPNRIPEEKDPNGRVTQWGPSKYMVVVSDTEGRIDAPGCIDAALGIVAELEGEGIHKPLPVKEVNADSAILTFTSAVDPGKTELLEWSREEISIKKEDDLHVY